MNDDLLLREWVEHHSEVAFTQLVDRHLAFVYHSALRQVRDPALAQDVTQAVFLLLARKASGFKHGIILTSWLFRSTGFIASRARRSELRRLQHETSAAAMNFPSQNDDPASARSDWSRLEPHLDAAVGSLPGPDRDAILLRFFDRMPLRDVGQALGLSEDAAKKKVSRALDKLRRILGKRGLELTGVALLSALTELPVRACPVGLGAEITKALNTSMPPMPSAPRVETLAEGGARDWMLATAKPWVAACLGGLALILAGVIWNIAPRSPAPSRSQASSASEPANSRQTILGAANVSNIATPSRVVDSAVSLIVLDDTTEQPLSGVRIRSSHMHLFLPNDNLDLQTDAQGHALLPVPADAQGALHLSVSAAGFVPVAIDFQGHEFIEPVLTHTCRLIRGRHFQGVVQDPAGVPIANVRLRVNRWGTDPKLRENMRHLESANSFFTDAQGRFQSDQLPPRMPSSGYFSISATHPEYVRNSIGITNLNQLNTDQVIVLQRGLKVRGRVVTTSNEPVAKAEVWENHHIGVPREETLTDANGEFELGPFNAGQIPVAAQAEGFLKSETTTEASASAKPIVLVLNPKTDPTEWEKEVEDPKWVRVTGTVVDEETGKPIPQFNVLKAVNIGNNPNFLVGTGRDGKFDWQLSMVFCRQFQLAIEAEEYAPAESTFRAVSDGDQTFEFRIQRSQSYRGRVLQPDGTPAAGAEVGLIGDGYGLHFEPPAGFGNYGDGAPRTVTGPDGVFRLPQGLNPRTVVFVHPTGTASMPASQVTNVLIHLQPWSQLSGTLLIDRRPAPGQPLLIQTDIADPNQPTLPVSLEQRTDAMGRFRFERLVPGRYCVQRIVNPHEGRPGGIGYSHGKWVTLEPGTEGQITLGDQGRSVLGRVQLSRSLPGFDWTQVIPKLEIQSTPQPTLNLSDFPNHAAYVRAIVAQSYREFRYHGSMAPDGSFKIEDVPAGNYTLSIAVRFPTNPETPLSTDGFDPSFDLGQEAGQIQMPVELPRSPVTGPGPEAPLDLGTLRIPLKSVPE